MTSTDVFRDFLHFAEAVAWLTFTCSESTKETVEKGQWHFSSVFIANYEHMLHLFLVLMLLTLDKYILAGSKIFWRFI